MVVEEQADVRRQAEEHLRALVGGPAQLREDQWRAIRALVVDRRRALVVQRTGWGKSAVYFVATALLRAAGAGPTVIVSPLLALMRNQVAAAGRAGIRARTVNSANVEEWDEVYAEVGAGQVGVGGVGVEVLRGPLDRDSLRLSVLRLPSNEHRLAWLAEHLAELPGSGIVYTLTVAATEEVSDYLRQRGHAVAAYSGQSE